MKIARIVMLAALAAALPAAAQKECTKADAAAAEKVIDRVVNSANLQRAWKDYRHCDTGAIDEIFTDAILRILVPWKDKDAEQVAIDVQADPEYKKFLHKHLRSDAAKADRSAVYSRAKSNCPPIQDEFCKELIEVVKDPAKAAPTPPAAAPAAAPKASGK
jgi:hypothetical protein